MTDIIFKITTMIKKFTFDRWT